MSQKTSNFASEPLQRVSGNIFRKSKRANRMRMKDDLGTRFSAFNTKRLIKYTTAPEIL